MKARVPLFFLATLALGLASGYRIGRPMGYRSAWSAARSWAIQEAAARAARQEAFDRKVWEIREDAAARRGCP